MNEAGLAGRVTPNILKSMQLGQDDLNPKFREAIALLFERKI